MVSGILAGAASIDGLEKRQEAIAANLANISTPGYKRRVDFFTVLQQQGGVGGRKASMPMFEVQVDFRPGEMLATGNMLDLALSNPHNNEGDAFFALDAGNRNEQYTRNGRFSQDRLGRLVHSSSGYPLLNTNGSPIRLDNDGGAIVVDKRGNLIQDGNRVGQVKVVRFGNLSRLSPTNHGLYSGNPASRPEDAAGIVEVWQGHIEASNTNSVGELVRMISNFRTYEATQRIIKQMDQSVQRLLRTVQ